MVAADRLEQVYRREATRIRAALAARLGDVGLAEDLVHDAFVEALEHWEGEGVPPNPGGWLATTARRKAIDRLRRERAGREKLELLAATEPAQHHHGAKGAGGPTDPSAANDRDADNDLLSLIFACCHPALQRDAQVALTLRVVCGLTTAEIAAAFLVSETAMARRLARSRRALRDTGSAVRVPEPDQLAGRLDEVLAVIYLVFNEGYLASGVPAGARASDKPPHGRSVPAGARASDKPPRGRSVRTPTRRDLATAAVGLNRLLLRLMPREPEVLGLLALLLLHESRAATRFDGRGRLVRLQDQDRARWDHALAAEAARLLSRAIELHRPGPYQIQAAIAAVHAQAPSCAETDWNQIRLLYDRLELFTPSPVVRLNRAVATRYAIGPQAALSEIEPLAAELEDYRLYHAVRADLLTELGDHARARSANERALALAANPAERELLNRRLSL